MTSLLAAVAAGTVLLTLLAGCAVHLSRPRGLPEALRTHRVLPARSVPAVTVAVPCAEGLLALAGAATLRTDVRFTLPLVLCAAAGLFTAYALYTGRVLATGRGGPCGCARTETPMNRWIAVRATVLAVVAMTAAGLLGPAGATLPTGPARIVTAALATAAFTVLLWGLPTAMHEPAPASPPVVADRASATGGPQWTS